MPVPQMYLSSNGKTTVFSLAILLCSFQDFPEVAGEISGMDDPADSPWRLEVFLLF